MSKIKTLLDTAKGYYHWINLYSIPNSATMISSRNDLMILTQAFPPRITGGVFRPFSLAKYAFKAGWDVSVICGPATDSKHPAGKELLNKLPKEIKIIRTISNLAPSYKLYPKVDGGFCNSLDLFHKVIKERGNVGPKIIFSTGPPFHSFIAGFFLANYYNTKLILDYRDEWTECPFDFVSAGKFDRWWESKCLHHANLVIFTTKSQKENNISKFPFYDHSKCIVVPNGWEPEEQTSEVNVNDKVINSDKICISFLGSLGGHTPPDLFLDAIADIFDNRKDLCGKVILKFIGAKSKNIAKDIDNFRYPENLINVNSVSKNEAHMLMRKADALLILNNINLERYIPGKLYDYLSSKTPILVYGNVGEVADLVNYLQAGIVVREDKNELEEALDHIVKCKKILYDNKILDKWLVEHTRENLAGKIIKLMDKL